MKTPAVLNDPSVARLVESLPPEATPERVVAIATAAGVSLDEAQATEIVRWRAAHLGEGLARFVEGGR